MRRTERPGTGSISMSESDTHELRYLTGSENFEELDQDLVEAPVAIERYHASGSAPTRGAIALALLLTIIGFTVQIEAIAYYQDVLGWPKPLLSLYLTHSSLTLPWAAHMLYLRTRQKSGPWRLWLKHYVDELLAAVSSVEALASFKPPIRYSYFLPTSASALMSTMAIVTAVLTISGVSWFVALAYTTPGDLTAIYNCSAFFAAVFSVPLLRQKIGWITAVAVALSILGTSIIAYGDAGSSKDETGPSAQSRIGASRLFGNAVAAIGAIAFGLYSVLFKRWTTTSQSNHASRINLTIAASGLTGAYTLSLGWIGIVLLHMTGVESFVVPSFEVALCLMLSILSGAGAMTLLLVLITWTSPVFGSVTAILSVFFVAIADWLLLGLVPSFSTYVGGGLIFLAFGMLARDS